MSAEPFEGGERLAEQWFKLIPFERIWLGKTLASLVKGLIPRTGLVVMWGPPKCGKSFMAFDLGMHIALGWKYRGRSVVQGPVVYLALEGGAGFKARVEAFRIAHLTDRKEPVPFFLVTDPVNLIIDHGKLIECIRTQVGSQLPVAVVIDTLNRSLFGSESSDLDMSAYVRAADAIRDAFGCAVIIVHHSGVDTSRPRGHTSLTGATDVQIAIRRDAEGNIIATVEYMKDGPEGAEFVSSLKEVDVGIDKDNDPISSRVVVPVDSGTVQSGTKPQRLTKTAATALRALTELIAENGEDFASTHIPAGTRSVTIPQWRARAYSRGITTSSEDRARQQAFKRASEFLIAGGHVLVWEDRVWKR